MSAANDVGRLISGAVEGAESLGTAAHNLARDKSMIDANGAQQESAK